MRISPINNKEYFLREAVVIRDLKHYAEKKKNF
jgi:hypothetical protein